MLTSSETVCSRKYTIVAEGLWHTRGQTDNGREYTYHQTKRHAPFIRNRHPTNRSASNEGAVGPSAHLHLQSAARCDPPVPTNYPRGILCGSRARRHLSHPQLRRGCMRSPHSGPQNAALRYAGRIVSNQNARPWSSPGRSTLANTQSDQSGSISMVSDGQVDRREKKFIQVRLAIPRPSHGRK